MLLCELEKKIKTQTDPSPQIEKHWFILLPFLRDSQYIIYNKLKALRSHAGKRPIGLIISNAY